MDPQVAAALVARLRALPAYDACLRPAMCRRWGIPEDAIDGMTAEEVRSGE